MIGDVSAARLAVLVTGVITLGLGAAVSMPCATRLCAAGSSRVPQRSAIDGAASVNPGPPHLPRAAKDLTSSLKGDPILAAVLDDGEVGATAMEILANTPGPLVLSTLGESEFAELPESAQQHLYDRAAALRALARSLSEVTTTSPAAAADARSLLHRLASDNAGDDVSRYVRRQAEFVRALAER